MRSLALKLTLAFLVVGLAGVVLVAIFITRQTRREFDQFVADRYQYELLNDAVDYYATNGSWEGIRKAIPWQRGQGNKMSPPVSLLDDDGRVIFSSIPAYTVGDKPANTGNDTNRVPVEVDGAVVGYLLFGGRFGSGNFRDPPEVNFLARLNRAVILGSVVASLFRTRSASWRNRSTR
ncbi:MAG: hypothetical protein DCC51_10675 [Anaerolineae bacterium]|nr:MAG: hypothetical protein DCC51_10675 [Anaerolineae bacterium]